MENKPKNLWKKVDFNKHQLHVTISTIDSTTESEDADERIVYMEDLEKRKQAYGICGECNEPGTGWRWCQPCNAKRFKDNFKNWTSGNKIKSHLQIHLRDVVPCNGITQDPNTKDSRYLLIWNEFLSEEIPYGDISHDEFLAVKICKGQRPKISEDVPRLLADLIVKCWDAEIENRPTTKELYQLLTKWNDEINKIINSEDSKNSEDSEIYSQIKVSDEIGEKKFESRSSKDRSKNIQTHPQAIYTSRLLNFKNLPKPVNSSDLSSCQINSDANYAIQSILANPNLLYVICFS
ncbi:uncharacterized protein OCT59_020077 [Rhizophagus irregularis]|uniref:uncharacterized protein n=1 Tax=Rhizophagus irregularis TaxID=588596 RepID=UPI0033286AC7|nr:hypothetical protein OCT59_020077 [Rhizophagus irregularis]